MPCELARRALAEVTKYGAERELGVPGGGRTAPTERRVPKENPDQRSGLQSEAKRLGRFATGWAIRLGYAVRNSSAPTLKRSDRLRTCSMVSWRVPLSSL